MSESQAPIDFTQVLNQLVINAKAGGDDASLAQGLREQGIPEDRILPLIAMARKRSGVSAPVGGVPAMAAPEVAPAPAEGLSAESLPQPAQEEAVNVTFTGPPLSMGAALVRAVIGGSAAAVIGGIIWGMVTVATDRELGLVAWGIGGIVGFGVLTGTRGLKGMVFQQVAVAASVAGIAIGKYITFVHLIGKMASEGKIEGITEIPMFSVLAVRVFVMSVPELLSGHDLLWVGLAVYTSWKMLSDKVKVAKA